MAGQLNRPIIIIDQERTAGKDAQSININAAKLVSDAVKTTLGPMGMDKMLVNPVGDVVITNDGATILTELEIKHPAAKMMVEVAQTQEGRAGDGTTTAVVLAGELLGKARELMDEGVHATTIETGYQMAAEKAVELLEEMAVTADESMLIKVARTSLSGKGAEMAIEPLARACVDAAKMIEEGGVADIKENINILHQRGGKMKDTEFVHGLVIDKARAHKNMPRRVENARIAVLDVGIEVRKTKADSKIKIESPDQLREAIAEEQNLVREMIDAFVKKGVNVVFTEKGIDDISLHYLARRGILAIRRCKEEEIKKIAKATGARVVSSIEDISQDDLGSAGLVEERGVGNYKMIYIEKCQDPKAVSILVRSGAEKVTEEVERALDDALHAVSVVMEDKKIVPGGGAAEVELALRLREYANTLGGREQLAVLKFAEALEAIPSALAENSGLDAIDSLVELKSAHERGEKSAGLDIYTGKTVDMLEAGVVDPLRVKTQAIKSAADAAVMILRVDDIFMAKETGMLDVKPEHRADYYDGISPPPVEDY